MCIVSIVCVIIVNNVYSVYSVLPPICPWLGLLPSIFYLMGSSVRLAIPSVLELFLHRAVSQQRRMVLVHISNFHHCFLLAGAITPLKCSECWSAGCTCGMHWLWERELNLLDRCGPGTCKAPMIRGDCDVKRVLAWCECRRAPCLFLWWWLTPVSGGLLGSLGHDASLPLWSFNYRAAAAAVR